MQLYHSNANLRHISLIFLIDIRLKTGHVCLCIYCEEAVVFSSSIVADVIAAVALEEH